jgi:polyphenol oxidase
MRARSKQPPFPFGKEPPRQRRSFYDLTDQEVKALCDVIGYMRDGAPKKNKPLHVHDPLQWDNYVATHARHCTEAEMGFPQVHWSWFFLPWHRAYLFFVDRHLAQILATVFDRKEESARFALPYWDWERHKELPNTKGRTAKGKPSPFFGYDLAAVFDSQGNGDPYEYNLALWDGYRGPTLDKPEMKPEHEPSTPWADYTRDIRDGHTSPFNVTKTILATPNFCVFGGGQYTDQDTAMGLLESSPHNTVHDWVGSRYGLNRDMGTLRYAALDPVFYLHHANIDRIWSLYAHTPDPDKAQPVPNFCGHTAQALKTWGDRQFEFLDSDGKLVSVTVRDTIKQMGNITYQQPAETLELVAALKRETPPRERIVTLAEKTIKLSNKPETVTVEKLAVGDKQDIREGKPVSAILEFDVGTSTTPGGSRSGSSPTRWMRTRVHAWTMSTSSGHSRRSIPMPDRAG